ncbi:hypothetical protein EWM64_g920 [Hericium alpestre]|uniref:Uncharacterized protein n=1 Tax=Hericium alpestre TaxID=135208 RepID=A0A4Z0A7P7_9AGAM|nr:hypothetical protein EWM64_g920 [Hericium alpestre]
MYLAMPSVVLTMIYPTLKRWTNLAPIPLGLMFGAGTCMGWSDFADPRYHWQVLVPLYAGFCLWTITFETIYQHQDRAEDIKLGLHSMAILFGRHTIPLCTLSALSFLSLMAFAGWQNGHGIAFYAGLVVAAWLLLPRLLSTYIDRPEDCKRLFLGSPFVGEAVLGGLLVDVVYHRFATGFAL